jgi:16S rRNA (adenine1518-N6/adenine1519-N6)-dimethyltransferase
VSLFPANPGAGARKRFGQHFLVDQQIIEDIVRCIGPAAGERIVEIGPGRGALTTALLRQGACVEAVEIDRDLVRELRRHFLDEARLTVHEGDALTFDFHGLVPPGERLRIVGNLPYNISTPLMLRLLKLGQGIKDMCFMLQKEVADRLIAHPGTSDYGRLAVMTQAFCEAAVVLQVPPTAFAPPPRVDSSVVMLRPHETPPCSFETLEKIVAEAFLHRRKMLRQTLGRRFSPEVLGSLGIPVTDRPENISVQQFIALATLAR